MHAVAVSARHSSITHVAHTLNPHCTTNRTRIAHTLQAAARRANQIPADGSSPAGGGGCSGVRGFAGTGIAVMVMVDVVTELSDCCDSAVMVMVSSRTTVSTGTTYGLCFSGANLLSSLPLQRVRNKDSESHRQREHR